LDSAKVIAVGPGVRDRDGKLVPVSLKEGDTVLLPGYGGTEVKLAEKEYVKLIYHMNLLCYFLLSLLPV
jgi:chaperonin GroES